MTDNSEQSSEPPDLDRGADVETSGAAASSDPSLSTTVIHDALADRRRRDVFRYLKDDKTPITLADLADEIAARETERSTTEISDTQTDRVHTSLWHTHIPKLVDAGVVECDRDRRTVTLTASAERIEPYLEPRSTE